MSELPTRRQRADAKRSSAAILEAAIQVLGQRPDATIEEIAAAAGVARQTVYAHYVSRETLLSAVVDRITGEVITAIDAVDLDTVSATDALRRWLDLSWGLVERYPLLLHSSIPAAHPADEFDRHVPIAERLTEVLRRGRQTGEFDGGLATTWLVAAVISLGHAAGQEVGAGRMSAPAAGEAFRQSVLRLCVRPS